MATLNLGSPLSSVGEATAPGPPYRWVNTLAFAGMVAMNYLAVRLPLNGKTTGQLSNQYPSLFTPAPATFAIWGFIYTLLAVFVIVSWRRDAQPWLDRIGYWFALSCLANATWIVAWHYERVGASVFIMLGLLYALVRVHGNLGLGRAVRTWRERLVLHLPFGTYLGWITVATCANVTAWLVDRGWQGGPLAPHQWAIALVLLATAAALWMLRQRGDVFYLLTVGWALAGIFLRLDATPPQQAIAYATLGGGLALLAAATWQTLQRARQRGGD